MSGEKEYLYNHLADFGDISDMWKPVLRYGVLTATHFEAPGGESSVKEEPGGGSGCFAL